MATRLAAILSLIVFATCLVVGGIQTGNPFSTTVARALVAMAGTFVVGLIIGLMGQKMLDESLNAEKEKFENFPDLTKETPRGGR